MWPSTDYHWNLFKIAQKTRHCLLRRGKPSLGKKDSCKPKSLVLIFYRLTTSVVWVIFSQNHKIYFRWIFRNIILSTYSPSMKFCMIHDCVFLNLLLNNIRCLDRMVYFIEFGYSSTELLDTYMH